MGVEYDGLPDAEQAIFGSRPENELRFQRLVTEITDARLNGLRTLLPEDLFLQLEDAYHEAYAASSLRLAALIELDELRSKQRGNLAVLGIVAATIEKLFEMGGDPRGLIETHEDRNIQDQVIPQEEPDTQNQVETPEERKARILREIREDLWLVTDRIELSQEFAEAIGPGVVDMLDATSLRPSSRATPVFFVPELPDATPPFPEDVAPSSPTATPSRLRIFRRGGHSR